jgi:hypothetical protein
MRGDATVDDGDDVGGRGADIDQHADATWYEAAGEFGECPPVAGRREPEKFSSDWNCDEAAIDEENACISNAGDLLNGRKNVLDALLSCVKTIAQLARHRYG